MKTAILSLTILSGTAFCSQAAIITGRVLSEADSTAVTGALCRLMDDEVLLRAVQTEDNGSFAIETSASQPVRLMVSMTGYKPTEILLSTGKGKVKVGNLYLSESGSLEEVTVTTQTVIDARGRTIVFPSEGEIKASPTAISLFQKLPLAGLIANPISRNLSIDGGMPIILIDGIPSTMDDVNALRPKDIARIEYSRMTPARYADRGGNGLIAIVLKKRDDGGSVYLYGRSAVNTAFVDASVAASYHQGPSQFRISYVPSWRNYQSVYDDASESYISPDFRVDLESHDRNPFDYLTNNLSVKYIYSPKESLVFSAAVNAGLSNAHRRVIRSSSDSQLGEYDSRDYSESREDAPSLDLYLRRDFNERNSLEAQVVGTLGFDSYHRDNRYYLDDDNTDRFLNEVDSRRRSLIAEISYTHSFNDNTSLSGGYQNTLSHSSNTYAKSDFRPVLTENNNYVYAKFSQRIRKVFLSLSTGAKMYWVKNDMNSRTFIKNRSTVQATYNVNQQWGMQFAFSYAPLIPSLSELTDYPQQSTPYLVSNGNPSLKVADNFVYQFMPSYSGKLFYAAMLLTYRNTVNATFSDVSYIGDDRFLSQTVNARHMSYAAATLHLTLKEIKGFGASVSLDFMHYETAVGDWSRTLDTFGAYFNLWWTKGKFTLNYWRNIPSKYLSGYVVRKSENSDALTAQFRPNKHWTIEAGWWYMFNKKGTQYPAWNYSPTNPGESQRHISDNGNMVVLSLTYNTDFGSIFRSGRRTLNNSDTGSAILKN